MAGIFHRLTCAAQCSRSINNLSPRREGEALASVTDDLPPMAATAAGLRQERDRNWPSDAV
jgi:hypothetical protein